MHAFSGVVKYALQCVIISNLCVSAALSRFWSKLATVKMDKATRMMALPELPMRVLAFMPPVQCMYVRECYDVLTDMFIDGELDVSWI